MAALIPRPAPGVGGWGFQLTSALAAKLLLTLKEIVRTDMLLCQKARQNRQFIAEMFLLISEFFG